MVNSAKQKGIHENCFSNFCELQLIFEGVASDPAIYTCLERETRVNHTFVSRSFYTSLVFHFLVLYVNIIYSFTYRLIIGVLL
ncbi:hypothetical protein A5844_002385 [Enterococcus sp. 10A9_DIV0425]|uniref:Uncharacterized protein n=1 Tax=Candidatus Enterococcus wittei TaxID=1987383 RepID=A0A242JWA7_9ENTE|nr:hypothetical protein A5844_002385 [Enterococcus sp. 10A9_DIV0425]